MYSLAFAVNNISTVVARKLEIHNPKESLNIIKSRSFECPILKVDQSVVVYLLNEGDEPLSGGIIPIFDEFIALEPSEDTTTIFESQQLKYY